MATAEKLHLKRQISLMGGVAIIVGTIIGSGIFISQKAVLEGTQSVGLCLIVWCACGIIAIIGSLCYAELGTSITKSGAEYVYLLEIYGSYPAFLYCFTCHFFLSTIGKAVSAMIVAEYLSAPIFGQCGSHYQFKTCLACVILLSITVIAVVSTKLAVAGNELFTFLKLIACGIVIVAGCVTLYKGKDKGLSSGFSGQTPDALGIVEASFSAFFAYSGWTSLNTMTEELHHSKKNLPRALIISLVTVMVVYLLMNMAYFVVLGPVGVLNSEAVAMSVEEAFLPTNFLMSVGVALSTIGGILTGSISNPRVTYAAARDGYFPEFISFIHVTKNTPLLAIGSQAIIIFPLVFFGDIWSLVNFYSFLEWIFIGMCMFGIIILRYRKTDVPKSYRVPIIFPIFMVIVTMCLVIVPLVFSPRLEYLLAVGMLTMGTLFYFPFVYFKKSLPGMDTLTLWVQLLFQVGPSDQNDDD